MSATATTAFRELPRDPRLRTAEPLKLRILEWAVVIPVVAFLGVRTVQSWPTLRPQLLDFLAWFLVVAATDLMPVAFWNNVQLALSLPILLAAGFVYYPPFVGLLAFLGSTDPREVRREITVLRGLFNRGQIALSVMSASALFHALGAKVDRWPLVLIGSLLALLVDCAVNTSVVLLATRLLTGLPVKNLLGKIHGGSPLSLMLGYTSFGLLAVVLATAFRTAGNWGLLAFLIPVLLARQMFVHGQRLSEASRALNNKTRMLLSVSGRIADERRDERLAVAAGLHDEVIPPLYQVHLMGQILRQDLASGRLLALEDDLPELLKATEYASEAMRVLIRDLRRSSLGPGGLIETLKLLARDLAGESDAVIKLDLEDVGGSPLVQLLAYQVAREALRNAVRHSGAKLIFVRLVRESDHIKLLVEDDGKGFSPDLVDYDSHFGIQLMRERVELAGGVLQITSEAGQGTRVLMRLCAEAPLAVT